MSITKKTLAVLLAAILLFMLVLSPIPGASNEHRRSCCGCDCSICLIASTLSLLRRLFGGMLPAAIGFCVLRALRRSSAHGASEKAVYTPVALKTVIIS